MTRCIEREEGREERGERRGKTASLRSARKTASLGRPLRCAALGREKIVGSPLRWGVGRKDPDVAGDIDINFRTMNVVIRLSAKVSKKKRSSKTQ